MAKARLLKHSGRVSMKQNMKIDKGNGTKIGGNWLKGEKLGDRE